MKYIYIYTHICALKFKGSVKLSPPVFYMSCFFVDSDHSFLKVHVIYIYIYMSHMISLPRWAKRRNSRPWWVRRKRGWVGFGPENSATCDGPDVSTWKRIEWRSSLPWELGWKLMGPGFPNCQRTKGSGDRHRSLKTTVFVVCWRRIWLKMFLLWWCGHETGKSHERTRNRREILRKKQNHLRTNGVLWRSRVLVWILLDHFQQSWFGSYLKCSPCFQIKSHNRIALELCFLVGVEVLGLADPEISLEEVWSIRVYDADLNLQWMD